MAGVRVVRQGVVYDVDYATLRRGVQRVQRRFKNATRPVGPVVHYFASKIKQSVQYDFKVGGRAPFPWKPNARNTRAAKGHYRQLVGAHGPKMMRGMTYKVVTRSAVDYDINVASPFPGELHQGGRKGPWTIKPRRAKFLRFVVAEDQRDYLARRRRAQKARKAGKRVKIPAGPGTKVVFARQVRHPGFPQRKFVVIRDGLVREGWRRPLQAYLFRGQMPPRS